MLYENLPILNAEISDGAFLFFDKNKHFGEQGKRLDIAKCELESFCILSLPHLFPIVKQFEWDEKYDGDDDYEYYVDMHTEAVIYPKKKIHTNAFQKLEKIGVI